MTRKIIIIFFIFSMLPNYGFSQWMSVENGTCGSVLQIKFKDENTGWYIAEENKLLYKTTNGGNSWKGIDIPNIDTLRYFWDLFCFGDTLMANVWGGRLIRSTNGGDNWFVTIPNINWRIGTIKLVNANLIFALAYNYTIPDSYNFLVKSTDKGMSWDSIHHFTIEELNQSSFSFGSDLVGYALGGIGYPRKVQKTIDGGRNWFTVYSDSTQHDDLFFIDVDNGFLRKEISQLHRTSDGGISWNFIGNYFPNDFLFENSNIGYLIRNGPNKFYKTIDGGRNWIEKYSYYVFPSHAFREFLDLEKVNKTFYIAGNDGGGIFKSTNNGDNWNNISLYDWKYDFNSCDFSNSTTGFIAGYRSGIRQTTNAGINWFENSSFKNSTDTYRRNVFKIQFLDYNVGWALTDTGFYKTTNAGSNWIYHNVVISPSIHYQNFYFVNKRIGFLIGANDPNGFSRIFKTTDSGKTFNSVYSIYNQAVNDIKFYDSLYGYVSIGNPFGGPNLIRTTDGGSSWIQYNIGFDYGYYKIHIVDKNIAYIGSDDLFKTTNGGDTWFNIYNNFFVNDIEFINERTGFVVSYGSSNYNLYYTINGGLNWSISNVGSLSHLNGIYLNKQGFGFAYGNSNKIYRTENFGGIVNVVNYSQNIPKEFVLHQNYPNPFNPSTKISYEILSNSNVTIKVFDILGKEVTTLVSERKSPGKYSAEFSADENFSSGIYFYSMFVNGKLLNTKKMVLQK